MARAQMDARIFRQEFEASFEALSGRVYSNFERHVHVVDDLAENDDAEIYVGMDFNVNPMTAIIAQRREPDVLLVLDAIEVETSNTTELAQELRRLEPRTQFIYVGTRSGPEAELAASQQLPFYVVSSGEVYCCLRGEEGEEEQV